MSSLRCSQRAYSTAMKRAVVVAGARTPFCKSYGELLSVDAIGLGVHSVQGLIDNTKLNPEQLDTLLWGNVVLQTSAPNIAREVVIDLNLPRHIVAHSNSMACASSMKTVIDADMMIKTGNAQCVIAGGSDSLSHAEVPLARDLTKGLAMTIYGGAKSPQGKVKKFFKHAGAPAKWGVSFPSVAERSTGKTMGYHADVIAESFGVPRAAQDEYAANSHLKALEARKKGIFAEEIVPMRIGDKIIEYDSFTMQPNLQKMATLKAAFRKPMGTITAANATGLTDGGGAVLLASEEWAKANNFPTDITIRAWENTAIDPMPFLLLAPAVGIPRVLDKAGLKLEDIDVFEIHEAFAAQVLSTLNAIKDPKFCDKYLNGRAPLGDIDHSKLNVNGGSLALGHPFAATGARVVTSAMNELRRSKKRYALLSVCAAGGLGSVMILERIDELSAQPKM